jgi:hypothetical protein
MKPSEEFIELYSNHKSKELNDCLKKLLKIVVLIEHGFFEGICEREEMYSMIETILRNLDSTNKKPEHLCFGLTIVV